MKRLEEYKFSEKVTPELLGRIEMELAAYRYAGTTEETMMVRDSFIHDVYTLFLCDAIILKDYITLVEYAFDLATFYKKKRSRDSGKNKH